jgi:hypothetical protein
MALLGSNPRGPIEEPFHDPAFFQQVSVNPEPGVATWPDGYDICSDVLRYHCEVGRMRTDDEMNAYFNPETSPAALHAKPNQ